jgi:hypothetical protein
VATSFLSPGSRVASSLLTKSTPADPPVAYRGFCPEGDSLVKRVIAVNLVIILSFLMPICGQTNRMDDFHLPQRIDPSAKKPHLIPHQIQARLWRIQNIQIHPVQEPDATIKNFM